jgi:hypothetical protein
MTQNCPKNHELCALRASLLPKIGTIVPGTRRSTRFGRANRFLRSAHPSPARPRPTIGFSLLIGDLLREVAGVGDLCSDCTSAPLFGTSLRVAVRASICNAGASCGEILSASPSALERRVPLAGAASAVKAGALPARSVSCSTQARKLPTLGSVFGSQCTFPVIINENLRNLSPDKALRVSFSGSGRGVRARDSSLGAYYFWLKVRPDSGPRTLQSSPAAPFACGRFGCRPTSGSLPRRDIPRRLIRAVFPPADADASPSVPWTRRLYGTVLYSCVQTHKEPNIAATILPSCATRTIAYQVGKRVTQVHSLPEYPIWIGSVGWLKTGRRTLIRKKRVKHPPFVHYV